MPTFLNPDSSAAFLQFGAAAAAFFPTALYLSVWLRDKARENGRVIDATHLGVRRLLRLNRLNVARLRALGLEPRGAPADFRPPDLQRDLALSAQEIADDELSELEEFLLADHLDQLERQLADLRRITAAHRNVGFFAGLDIAILLAAVAAIIVGAITSALGVGAVLFALGVAVLFVDILAKLFAIGAGLAISSELAALQKEIEEKKASYEALLEGAAQ